MLIQEQKVQETAVENDILVNTVSIEKIAAQQTNLNLSPLFFFRERISNPLKVIFENISIIDSKFKINSGEKIYVSSFNVVKCKTNLKRTPIA